jgi:tetratricopeptide (TPR) repeat protein
VSREPPTSAAEHRPLPALALALCVALACATAPRNPSSASAPLNFSEGSVVEGDSRLAELAAKDAAELLAAAQAGDHALAAAAFARLADAFPDSPQATEAGYRAGLAYRRLERWDLALERFQRVAELPRGPESDDAAFLEAESLYRLGRSSEARALLDTLAVRDDLPREERARALTQRGVVELEDGDVDDAERSLQLAISAAAADGGQRREGERYYPAKARFYLGEVARSRFEKVALDPQRSDASELTALLEEKSSLLLSAQERYLAAIQTGDAGWAVAAGVRVGELYDELQQQMLEAPLPSGLDGGAARAYQAQLRQQVRVLVAKAIDAYRETLAAAHRTGVDSAFVARADEALQRMERVLAETDAASGDNLRSP